MVPPELQRLTAQLRLARQRAGTTTEELSKTLGVSSTNLKEWEQGLTDVPASALLRWAEAVNATLYIETLQSSPTLANAAGELWRPGDPIRNTLVSGVHVGRAARSPQRPSGARYQHSR